MNRTYVELRPLHRNIRQAVPLYHPRVKAAYIRTTREWVCVCVFHTAHTYTQIGMQLSTYVIWMYIYNPLLSIIYCNLSGRNTLINELPVKRILLVCRHSRLCSFLPATTLVSAAECRVVTARPSKPRLSQNIFRKILMITK